MQLLLLLTSALLLLPWTGAGRIIGGREAKPHSRPYMAFLSIQNELQGFRCGGLLIRQDTVLSAAHCMDVEGKMKITVTLGAHNISKEEPSQQKFRVDHWVIHPKYSKDTLENDIMLLKLKPKARLTEAVSLMPLPQGNKRLKPGTICEVAGWGLTSTTENQTSVLLEVDLKVQSKNVCEEYFKGNYLQRSMICVGDEDGQKSSFLGDSGGPLVCNGKAHGITSFGLSNSIFPQVFTRVSYFVPWIDKELRKFALQDPPDSSSSD